MVNMNQIMKQAQEMQRKVAALQAEREKKEYQGSSGGNMVTVMINGKGEMTSIKLDSSIIDKDEVEMLEDLIRAAFNEAKKKMDDDAADSISSVMGGLPAGLKNMF
jgi:nucleoid-associated protein EbfC